MRAAGRGGTLELEKGCLEGNEATFPALGVCTTLGEQEIQGKLTPTAQALLFESESANAGFPTHRLVIERDTAGRIMFSDPEQPEWTLYCPSPAVLAEPPFQKQYHLREQVQRMEQSKESRRVLRLSVIFLACFGLVAAVLTVAGRGTVNFLVARVPLAWEQKLGESVYAEIKEELKVVEHPRLAAELKGLVERVAPADARRSYKFDVQIVDAAEPNAFALPAGRLLVTTGLFQLTTRPEEIAGVLAHEVAHVTQRHGLRHVITTVGPYYLLRMFVSDEQGFMSVISQGSQLLLSQNFSRAHEKEADKLGWGYLLAARIDPRGLAGFLGKMSSQPVIQEMEDAAPRVLRSHPPSNERIADLGKLWEESPKRTGFVVLPPLDTGALQGVEAP
jgi:Zn-dependent protease with chaperone function